MSDVVNFDLETLHQLRCECDIYQIDFKRARLEPDGDGRYTVRLDRPLIDLGALLTGVPSTVPARNGGQAEGLMMSWLKRIQVAERQQVRFGSVCGWSTDQINRRPLEAGELAAYRARAKHIADVARLQAQLTKALETTAKNAAVKKAHDELTERYGMNVARPDQLCQPPALNAPKRKPAPRNAK